MRIYNTQNMKQVEAAADSMGHSYRTMMLMAGRAVARCIIKERRFGNPKTCAVFCGAGNNGGDGYVVAQYLAQRGWKVVAIFAGKPSADDLCAEMYAGARAAGVRMLPHDYIGLEDLCKNAAVLVDAMVGTGFSGELRGAVADCVAVINAAPGRVYAVDLPTGVSADNGKAACGAVRADVTLTFDCKKPGHFIAPGRNLCGRVMVQDIGIPTAARTKVMRHNFYVGKKFVAHKIKPRPKDCHKGDFGKLLAVVGSGKYMGAALLCVQGALRSGVGYVTMASPKEVCKILLPSAPECIMMPCSATREQELSEQAAEKVIERAKMSTAVVIGCGIGTGKGAERAIEGIIKNSTSAVLIDADGLNLLAKNMDWLSDCACQLVLTPHPAEFARLLGCSVDEVLADSYNLGRDFARHHGLTLLLKGAVTLVFSPDGVCRYVDCGNPGMAKAGSGDVLAGVIGALLAQGMRPFDAAACGGWLHGRAGSIAAQKYSTTAMLPRELASGLGDVFLSIDR